MPKSPQEMAAAMVANMKEKTGKTLAAWLKIARASGLEKHGLIVKHLKAEHGMTHGFANLVASEALKGPGGDPTGQELIEAQYAGKKEGLRPIYKALATAVSKLGGDVELAPKKAYVSLRRSKQFALIQPSTATRVDVGLQLKGTPASQRLEASGSFNAMVSHRVRLSDKSEVDSELRAWLKQAYEEA